MIQARYFKVFGVKALQWSAVAVLAALASPVYAAAVAVSAARGLSAGLKAGLAG